jgi:hypothetical protein
VRMKLDITTYDAGTALQVAAAIPAFLEEA